MSAAADRAPPRRVLVACIGNAERGDDAAGPLVARRLAGRLPADVAVLTRGGDMLALIEDWAGFDACVCVDAAAPMGAPGRIHRVDLRSETLPRGIAPTSSHAFGLSEAVALARALRRAPRDIVVYALEGRCFDCGAPVAREVNEAAGQAADAVVAEVARLRDPRRRSQPPSFRIASRRAPT